MMKKIFAVTIVAVVLASSTGCGMWRNSTSSSVPPSSVPPVTSSVSPSVAPSVTPEPPSSAEPEIAPAASMDELFETLRTTYGESYLANSPMSEEHIANVYGLTPDMYEEVRGEMSLISAHPDEVIIVKAKPGKADEVEAALKNAMETKKSDAVQYPMNVPKTGASRVVRHGDYVAYLLVGAPIEDNALGETERQEHFERETQRGADALAALFERA